MATKKRNLRKEYDTYHGTEEQKKNRAKRNKARRDAIRAHGKSALKGKEVDHKKPLSKGGSNSKSNRRIVSRRTNRKKGAN